MTEESRALVLDFGGVITRTLFETHPMTEKVLGLPSGSLTWRGPFEPDSDPLWVAMQNGELTEREYWTTRTQEVGEMVGESWTEMSQFLMAARGDDPEPIIRHEALTAFDEAREAAKIFQERGVKTSLITLGEMGCYFMNEKEEGHVPAFDMKGKVVETTGAGDGFNGGFAAALAEGKDPDEAIRFASATAAISVTRLGTAPAMPSREEILDLIDGS